jgi:NADPH:quinone reductase-like Zn-dependent oxidoreductase
MADKGIIKIRVGKVLPLAEVSQAHFLMDERMVSGKIVLEMN